jgi:hypothetical protein
VPPPAGRAAGMVVYWAPRAVESWPTISQPCMKAVPPENLSGLARLITVVICQHGVSSIEGDRPRPDLSPGRSPEEIGLGPGSVLEWSEEGENIVVRKAGRYSSEDIHRALFSKRSPKPRKLEELKEAVGRHVREKHARR